MPLNRRQFAQGLGAAAILLPFMRGFGRAAGTPVRRIVVMTSLGIDDKFWMPASAPGAPLALGPAFANLQPLASDLIMANNLGFINSPAEGHSTPQPLTGLTFDRAYRPTTQSIDQFIAQKLAVNTKMPSLLLGVIGKNESHSWANGARVPPIDSPVDAFQTAFGTGSAVAAPPATSGATPPRKQILDLVSQQIKAVQANLGRAGKARLDAHLTSVAQLEASLAGTGTAGAGCNPGALPTLDGANPQDSTATAKVAAAHAGIIVNALACDVTRVIGMQFGISNNQYLQYSPSAGIDEHSANHSPGPQGDAQLLACEGFLSTWFANLLNSLKTTTDPLNPGTTLLDNTLLLWGRDIGDGPDHLQFGMPYVLAGATDYLKHSAGGAYFDYGGNNTSRAVGTSHQRLLLNLAEYMGVNASSGFGDFSKVGAAEPLTDLKK